GPAVKSTDLGEPSLDLGLLDSLGCFHSPQILLLLPSLRWRLREGRRVKKLNTSNEYTAVLIFDFFHSRAPSNMEAAAPLTAIRIINSGTHPFPSSFRARESAARARSNTACPSASVGSGTSS